MAVDLVPGWVPQRALAQVAQHLAAPLEVVQAELTEEQLLWRESRSELGSVSHAQLLLRTQANGWPGVAMTPPRLSRPL